MFHSQICWTLIKYITALFATFTSSDRYHKYGLVEEWTLLEGLSKTNVRATFLEDVTGKVQEGGRWGQRPLQYESEKPCQWTAAAGEMAPRLKSLFAVLMSTTKMISCCLVFFVQEDNVILRDKKYAFPDFSFSCKLNNCHWLSLCHVAIFSLACRQDKDIVLFLLTCGSCLDLVDLLDKDLALILSTC